MAAHKAVYFNFFENDEVYMWLAYCVGILGKYVTLLRQRGGWCVTLSRVHLTNTPLLPWHTHTHTHTHTRVHARTKYAYCAGRSNFLRCQEVLQLCEQVTMRRDCNYDCPSETLHRKLLGGGVTGTKAVLGND